MFILELNIILIHLNWTFCVLTVVCQSENYGIQTILSIPNKNLSFYNKLHDKYRYWKSLNSNGKDICWHL